MPNNFHQGLSIVFLGSNESVIEEAEYQAGTLERKSWQLILAKVVQSYLSWRQDIWCKSSTFKYFVPLLWLKEF